MSEERAEVVFGNDEAMLLIRIGELAHGTGSTVGLLLPLGRRHDGFGDGCAGYCSSGCRTNRVGSSATRSLLCTSALYYIAWGEITSCSE